MADSATLPDPLTLTQRVAILHQLALGPRLDGIPIDLSGVDTSSRAAPIDPQNWWDVVTALAVPKVLDAVTTHQRQAQRWPDGRPVYPESGWTQGGSHFQNPAAIDAVIAGTGIAQAYVLSKLLKNHPTLANILTSSIANNHLRLAQQNVDQAGDAQRRLAQGYIP